MLPPSEMAPLAMAILNKLSQTAPPSRAGRAEQERAKGPLSVIGWQMRGGPIDATNALFNYVQIYKADAQMPITRVRRPHCKVASRLYPPTATAKGFGRLALCRAESDFASSRTRPNQLINNQTALAVGVASTELLRAPKNPPHPTRTTLFTFHWQSPIPQTKHTLSRT